MNNIHRIEEFLKLMATDAKDITGFYMNYVAKKMKHFGVGTKKIDISTNFPLWVDRFLNNPNINVYVNPNWNYFCQFKSSNGLFSGYNAIKLYIPLDKEHIFDGANQLFDFLIREKIPHVSKIGKYISMDDIVVRVDTPENANKVIKFVNNNLYLRKGGVSTSPFVVDALNVSVAWDGHLSYNEVVSSWISRYINWEKSNNNLDGVSFLRFYAFMEDKCDLYFEKGFDLPSLIEELTLDGIFEDEFETSIELQLLNYYDVTCLILLVLGSKMKKEDVYMYVNKVKDESYQRDKLDKFSAMLHNNRIEEYEVTYTEEQKTNMGLAFSCMYEKCGYNIAREQFLEFMIDGDYERITRYGNARKIMKDSCITREIALKIANDWNEKNIIIEGIMNSAITDTYDKFGKEQVVHAVKTLFKNNDFSYLTNRNGYRKQLKNEFVKSNILLNVMEILTRKGYEINYENVSELSELYLEDFDLILGRGR